MGDWIPIPLGDVCTKIGSGATPHGGSGVYLSHGPYALIRSQNVHNNGFRREGLVYIGDHHASELANVEVFQGDVLLNITGDSVARACQVDPQVLPARVNQHVAIIRPDPRKLDPGYLRYYLIAPIVQAKLLSWAGSGGTRNALTKTMIEAFEILAPQNVNEQGAIACILRTLDDKIELNRRMNDTLDAIVKALFKSWFIDFDPVRSKRKGRETGLPKAVADLFPESFENSKLGMIPKGWKVRKLGELCSFEYGKALKAEHRKDGSVPVYGANGQVGWHDQALCAGPGIIIGRKGNPGVVTWTQTDFFPIDTTFYVVPAEQSESLHFLFHALRNQDLESLSADSAVPGLNRNVAYLNEQIVASGEALEAFEKIADLLSRRKYHAEENSRTLEALRDMLLPKLISGELRVYNVEQCCN